MQVPEENERLVLSYRVAALPYLIDEVEHGLLRSDGVEVYMEVAQINQNHPPLPILQKFYNFGYCNEIDMFHDNPCLQSYPSANALQARHFVQDSCVFVAARVIDHVWRRRGKVAAIRFITKLDRIAMAHDRPADFVREEDLAGFPDRNTAEGHVRNFILNLPAKNNLHDAGDHIFFFMLTCT